MFDVAILGGGIAGLYTAYRILSAHPETHLLLLEKSASLGGRIETHTDRWMSVEAGAGRFAKHHRRLLGLIDEMGLSKHVIPIPGEFTFVSSSATPYTARDVWTWIRTIQRHSESVSKDTLRNTVFLDYAKQVLRDDTKTDFMVGAFGYSTELVVMNAHDALAIVSGMTPHTSFCVLRGGLASGGSVGGTHPCVSACANSLSTRSGLLPRKTFVCSFDASVGAGERTAFHSPSCIRWCAMHVDGRGCHPPGLSQRTPVLRLPMCLCIASACSGQTRLFSPSAFLDRSSDLSVLVSYLFGVSARSDHRPRMVSRFAQNDHRQRSAYDYSRECRKRDCDDVLYRQRMGGSVETCTQRRCQIGARSHRCPRSFGAHASPHQRILLEMRCRILESRCRQPRDGQTHASAIYGTTLVCLRRNVFRKKPAVDRRCTRNQ